MNCTRKILAFLFLLASFWFLIPEAIPLANAQQQKAAKYWTIENNIKDKTYTIVRYYGEHDELVLEKRIEKKFIKLNKRDIRKLNKNLAAYNAGIKKEEYLTRKK
tara:strand:- start:14 stop:328 length:315 start_codon:yes stop_codon:yes gene_type:complete